MARQLADWPRRVWGVRMEEIHPGLLRWVLGLHEWRWHFWGGAVSRDGTPLGNFTGSVGRAVAWSFGYEEGHRDGEEAGYGEDT